jgi:hypothetical protein
MFDVNVYQENIFHTKMHLKDFDLDTYLFEEKAKNLSFKERMRCASRRTLKRREIEELFHGAQGLLDCSARVLRECGVAPERFVMVGNSMRSDIEPVLRLGGWGVHVPYRLTWALEAEHTVDAGHARFCTVADAAGIPAALAGLGV